MNKKYPFSETNPFLRLREKPFSRREPSSPAAGANALREQAGESARHEESGLFLQSVRALPLKNNTQASDVHDAEPADGQTSDFARAMRDVRPLKGKGRDVAPHVIASQAAPALRQQSFQELLDNTLEFALHFSEEYVEGHVVGLESGILQKLRARQYSPEAHLDLHGLNACQAFGALVGFVRHCWHRGMRTILLIPGRGKNSPDGVAVLRKRVQSWLTQEPLKRVVLAFCTARPVDGGLGSLYVLLRKCKKKGKVHWERIPADLDL